MQFITARRFSLGGIVPIGKLCLLDVACRGQWRILCAFQLAAALGYEYALMIDDDFFFKKPVGFNFISVAKELNIDWASQVGVIEWASH